MPILDFTDRFPNRELVEHAYRNASSLGDRTLPATGVMLDPVAVARVDHSRWIADCPFDGCPGAEFVSFDRPVFFCCECRNATVGHVPVRVELPAEKLRAQVEAYLVARPIPATRNWSSGESVKQLQDENREHGIKL